MSWAAEPPLRKRRGGNSLLEFVEVSVGLAAHIAGSCARFDPALQDSYTPPSTVG
jgi:hypothetical protein